MATRRRAPARSAARRTTARRTASRSRRRPGRQVRRRRLVVVTSLAAAFVVGMVLALLPLTGLLRATDRTESWNPAAFDPGHLIDDDAFYDDDAMTAEQIQDFLDDKTGPCQNTDCLSALRSDLAPRDAVVSDRTGQTVCRAWEGGNLSAAEIIDRVQRACGISARVLLVTLQKEQSLVTGRTARAPSAQQLGAAMGARCPDSAPCDAGSAGFAEQIARGATDLASYRASNFMRQPGTHWIAYSPDPACGGSDVVISNDATAALYNYTPYQPNPAALAAGSGTGDGCSAYGNRNFVMWWTRWFG